MPPTLGSPLTAVGAGSATFAAFVPSIQNVLFFPDILDSTFPAGLLSYSVYGWYSDPAADPLGGPWGTEDEWTALMQSLGWSVGSQSDLAAALSASGQWAAAHGITQDPKDERTLLPTRTVCHGLLFGVQWLGPAAPCVSSVPPKDDTAPDYVQPQIAVGHTAIDALAAMLAQDDSGALSPGQDTTLLARIVEAFQYDALPLLDGRDAAAQVYERVQSAWFGTSDGGRQWSVVAASGGEVAEPPGPQAALLTALNAAQRELDASAGQLAASQWQLYGYWTMGQNAESHPFNPKPPVPTAAMQALETVIDAEASRYRALRQRRDAALVELQQTLPSDLTLHGAPRPPFQTPNDPVVLVNGARRSYKHGEDGRFSADGTLFCRFSGQTISSLRVAAPGPSQVEVTAAQVPLLGPAGSGIPLEAKDLDAESFFLDTANAPLIADVAYPSDPWPLLGKIRQQQTLIWNPTQSPALDEQTLALAAGLGSDYGPPVVPSKVGVEAWAPPWAPLLLSWQITYYPGAATPAQTVDPALWGLATHASGDPAYDLDYSWLSSGPPPTSPSIPFSGQAILTPSASDLLAARIEQMIEHTGDSPALQPDLWALQDALDYVRNADLLSQSLSGLGTQMLERRPDTFASGVENGLGQWLAAPGTPAFAPDTLPGWGPYPDKTGQWHLQLNSVRAGHFVIDALNVVDGFGQVFDVKDAAEFASGQFPFIAASDMATANDATVLEMKPRITQASRLDFAFLDAEDDGSEVGVVCGADPVCGWVLANQLDQSLLFYDGGGAFLGELLATESGQVWLTPPEHGPLPGSARVEPVISNRHLHAMVDGILAAPNGVLCMLATIDAASSGKPGSGAWTDDELQVLLGRPLAVVRARVAVDLEQPLATSQAWADVGNGVTAGYEQISFPVQLGSSTLLNDGVVGCYIDGEYGSFESVFSPRPAQGYIGTGQASVGFGPLDHSLLTLVVDPSLDLHAVSGVLPPLAVSVPAAFAAPDLTKMEATFRVGPVLDDASQGGVTLPLPSLREGTWSWLEYDQTAAKAVASPVQAADPAPLLPTTPAVLRNGWLRLLLAEPATKLTYSIVPGAVRASTEAELSIASLAITAYNGTPKPVACLEIDLQVALGAGPDALTTDAGPIVASADGWTLSADGNGGFKAIPARGAPVAPGASVAFNLASIPVNSEPGRTTVSVTEETDASVKLDLSVAKVSS